MGVGPGGVRRDRGCNWRGCTAGDRLVFFVTRWLWRAPRLFRDGKGGVALPRNGANIDIITPPPTARQPERITNPVPDTSNCSGEPGTVRP